MSGLEPGRATLEAWLQTFARLGFDQIDSLEHRPAAGVLGDAANRLAAELSLPVGEQPAQGGAEALAAVLGRAADAGLLTPGPGYLAYIPGGGLPSSAIADLVSGLLNRYTGVATAAPVLCRLEQDVLTWLARTFGLPETTRGLLTSGGSLANFAAVVTARHRCCGESGDLRTLTVYTSTQAHHSVMKAVRLTGIPAANVRAIAVDSRLRLDVNALAAAITEDRRKGARPLMVVSNAGTTNTGAVDPLPAIADVCTREDLWHHVDGAYGGAFVLCEEGRQRLSGIERADSVTFDPHKGLFLPYGTGCLLVRQGELLRAAHGLEGSYLQDFAALDRADEAPSPSEYGPELSRDFRGLRLWLPLQLHGVGAFRQALAEKLDLAKTLQTGLQGLVDAGAPIELLDTAADAPQLSVVAWRLTRGPSEPLARWNRRNLAWHQAINARNRVHLSSTTLPSPEGPAVILRACVLSFRTHMRHVARCLEDIAAALASTPGLRYS